MTRAYEIAGALRGLAKEVKCSPHIMTLAADLIDNQQRHIEALMQANAGLRDTVLRRDAQIEKMSAELAKFASAVAVKEKQT